jgi:hypothetical protein
MAAVMLVIRLSISLAMGDQFITHTTMLAGILLHV